MKNILSFRSLLVVAALTLMVAMVSSCNRGVGCPYKFSANTQVGK